MKSYVVIEVTHKYALPHLGGDISNRAHSMQGVDLAEHVGTFTDNPVKKSAAPTAGDKADAYDGFLGFAA